MAANAVVRARVDQRLKDEASSVLEAVGLTVSDAVRLMLVRTVAEKALPFDPLVPNKKTIAALTAAKKGKLKTIGKMDDLMAELNADD